MQGRKGGREEGADQHSGVTTRGGDIYIYIL